MSTVAVRAGRERSPDPRPAATRAALRTALVRLLAEHGDAQPSVTAVIGEAGISRRSFYQHYESLGELSAELIDELFQNIAEDDRARRISSGRSGYDIARSSLRILLAHIQGNADLYRALLSYEEPGHAHAGFVNRAQRATMRVIEIVRPEFPAARKSFTAEVIAGGLAHAVGRWIDAENPDIEAFLDAYMDTLPGWLVSPTPLPSP